MRGNIPRLMACAPPPPPAACAQSLLFFVFLLFNFVLRLSKVGVILVIPRSSGDCLHDLWQLAIAQNRGSPYIPRRLYSLLDDVTKVVLSEYMVATNEGALQVQPNFH